MSTAFEKEWRYEMTDQYTIVEKSVRISKERASNLSRLARAKALSEDQIVERALDSIISIKGGRDPKGFPGWRNPCIERLVLPANYSIWRKNL